MGDCFRIVWICGAPGAGKSATAWGLWKALVADGRSAAYLDIDQVGMLYPDRASDPHRYARRVAADDEAAADALRTRLQPRPVTIVRLTAHEATYRDRLARRRRGENAAHLAGDDLAGTSEQALARALTGALSDEARSRAHPFEDRLVDVSNARRPG